MAIIGSVVWNPQKPTAGQSVKIDVCGPDGKPYGNQQSAYIGINGVPGSAQFLQFALPGDQKISVTAMAADGTKEQKTVTITVAALEPSPATLAIISDPANSALTKDQIAWLKVTADVNLLTVTPRAPYDAPYHVQFSVLPLSRFVRRPASPAPTPPASTPKPVTSPIAKPASATVAAAGANAEKVGVQDVAKLDTTPAGADVTKPTTPGTRVATPPGTYDTYTWDFGDGSKATTDTPSVSHDFEPVLSNTREFHQFHINVTGTRKVYTIVPSTSDPFPGPTSTVDLGSWTRTLSVHNSYVACKNRGYVIPKVTVGGWATKAGTNFFGIAVIKNNEPVPLTLLLRQLIPVLEDSDALTVPAALEAPGLPILVPANGSVPVPVLAPFSQVPADALGFSAVFSEQPVGSGVDKPTVSTNPIAGLKVRATAHFLVHPEYRGKTVQPAAATPAVGTVPRFKDMVGPAPDPVPTSEVMPPVAVGNQCDPDNLPEGVPANLACQMTPQTQTIETSARFLNARKGDVVLCPSVGDASLVDSMFALLTPAQLYGHSGIMTRNYEQITHCTACQSRIQAYKNPGKLSSEDNGFDPEALKYAWPGVLTQTVDHAVNGERIADPASSTGQQYMFQDFLGTPSAINIGGQFVVIPPLIVKPDPLLETTAVRNVLTHVADDAYANTGHFHYRFYDFTNPAVDLVAPKTGLGSPSAWAEGTRGAVCSSFIWMMMKGRGVKALGPSKYATEGELSTYAKQNLQVELDPNNQTLDGLFYYSEKQRSVCADWLYNTLWNYVRAQITWFEEGVTQAANIYADQLCNTFAADDSNTPDESAGVRQPWLSPGDANAVSPDNLIAWNGPGPHDGVLGYSEPLIYLPSSEATVPIYKWASVTQRGKLTGHVYLDGKPKEGVTVSIAGTDKITGTDKNGSYSFDDVPYGQCIVKAQVPVDSGQSADGLKTGKATDAVGQASVHVDKATVVAPDIKLKPPDDPHNRQVAIKGYASLDCSEWDWGSTHYTQYPQIEDWVDVGSGNPLVTWNKTLISKDATAQFIAPVTYNPDESVDILFMAFLDCPGGAASNYPRYNVPAGKSVTFVIGNSSSWLNGKNGYFYDGIPDLEAKNDTLCCSITFTNNEWRG